MRTAKTKTAKGTTYIQRPAYKEEPKEWFSETKIKCVVTNHKQN